jgi:hypothetical protein
MKKLHAKEKNGIYLLAFQEILMLGFSVAGVSLLLKIFRKINPPMALMVKEFLYTKLDIPN